MLTGGENLRSERNTGGECREQALLKGKPQGCRVLYPHLASACATVPVNPTLKVRPGPQEGVSGAFQIPREEILKSWEICVLTI